MAKDTLHWLKDLRTLSPTELRLARLALNLHFAPAEDKARLSIKTPVNVLQCLLEPLLDSEVVGKIPGDNDLDDDQDLSELLGENHVARHRRWATFLSNIPKGLLEDIRVIDTVDPISEVTELLCNILELDEVERQLLLFLDVMAVSSSLREMCRSAEHATRNVNCERLAMMLELDQKSVQCALSSEGRLRRLSFLQQTKLSDLEDFLVPDTVLVQARSSEPRTEEELLAVFLEPLSAPATNVHDFPHLSRHANLLQSVLGEANRRGEVGVNALFYGPSGTGKTEFAKAISASLGVSAYSVKTMNADGEPLSREDRLGSYQIAQVLLGSRNGELLIFDEIEDLQSNDELMLAAVSGYAPSQDKGWFNRVLETNPVPTIWITNHLRSLDPAARRRFLVPVEFKTPPRSVRRGIAAGMLASAGISGTLIDQIAADTAITPAILDNARRIVDLCPASDAGTLLIDTLADQRRTLYGRPACRLHHTTTTIDPGLLNIDGVESVTTIIDGIRRSGAGRLCLYGKPGTGKTQFARILAESLDRELLVTPASEVLSPYVGETEQNLAELFERADPLQSVILLDEIDSFLADRSAAERNWERTMVNELLQQMERYTGVFVAATNLMSGLDPAAMRRFDLKLQFGELTRHQRYRMFAREALCDDHAEVPETTKRLLDPLEGLTLGDVANVQRQRHILGEARSPEHFVRRLRAEWDLKKRDAAEC